MSLPPARIVTAAVVQRDGLLLITRRPEGTHMAGCWEFPGGKCEENETPEECLVREMQEELGVRATVRREIYRTLYAYESKRLDLRFFDTTIEGMPVPLIGQEIRWVSRLELPALPFPPADAELVRMLAAS